MADLTVLLDSILSDNNETRGQAEEQLNSLPVESKLQLLVSVFIKTPTEQHHLTAAILLRRTIIQTGESILKCPPDVLEACKADLLLAVQQEGSAFVRRKLCDAVAELARYCVDEDGTNHWPEILKFLFACCDLNLPHLYESALNIISVVPTIFGDQQLHYLSVIKQMLVQALGSPTKEVWMAAVKATVAFVMQVDNNIRGHFLDVLPLLLEAVERSVQLQEDDTALKTLLELAENCPRFLRPQLERVLDYMLKLSGTETVDDSWRHLGFEMVILLAENAPSMVRKHSRFLPLIVAQALKFMMDLEDDSDWSLSDEAEEEDSNSNAVVGETSLDRLAIGLGGKAILPHVISNIPQMLQAEDWRWRHAALMAVSAVGEGCLKQMRDMLEGVVDAILPFCQDQHHRVRFAACNAIGQLANDFAPTLQKKFHTKVVPALLVAMEDFPNPRVQSHAGAAMVNFVELCPKNILTQYTDLLVNKLEQILNVKLKELLEKGTKLVLEQMVTTVATVADTLEEHFLQYYDRFMPLLKYLMANSIQKENRLLRGKTIECISLIGLAVGKEKFMQDAAEVMQLLLKVQNEQGEELEDDDPQISYMISAWARMCKILGDQFVQYLPVVMKPLLHAAKMRPEVAIVDADEMMYSEDDGWEFITLADQQKFGIKTAGLEDKVTACQMLVIYARDLKEGFVEYAEPVAEIMVPHLRFVFHELVRAAAAESLPHLLECVKAKGPTAVQAMWNFISDKLLEAIGIEPDPDILAVMMDSLCKCIELLGANCFTPEQYSKLVEILRSHMETRFTNEKQRQEKRKDEDYDEEVEEVLEEEDLTDEQYLCKVADVMHSLFGTHGSTLLPFFDQLLPIFSAMLGNEQPACNKQWALCIFDDLLEFASEDAIKYKHYFLQPLMQCICDKSPAVRQAAVYGIGVMAQCCAKDFYQACIDALPMLSLIISDNESRCDLPTTNATENAISAVTKVCLHLENQVPLESILPVWLSWLPVYEDKEEAPHVYSYLCKQIENNNPLILGQDNCNVPRLLQIFTKVIEEDALVDSPEIYDRVLNLCRHIQSSGSVWTACLKLLTAEQQKILTTAIA